MNLVSKVKSQTDFMKGLIAGADEEILANQVIHETLYNHSIMRSKISTWESNGTKTFLLSNDLVEAFKNTDIPDDISPGDFHYPFETFYIEGHSPLFYTEDTNRPIHGIMYLSGELAMREAGQSIDSIMNREGELREKLGWDHSITAFYTNELDMLESIWLNCKNSESLKAAFRQETKGITVYKVGETENKQMINLFYNTVLYINDPHRSPETEEKKERKYREYKGGPWKESKYILLRPPKTYSGLSTGKSWNLSKSIIVRGHWRNQAYGEKRLQRRRTWIMPHRKGPVGEIDSKPYKVER